MQEVEEQEAPQHECGCADARTAAAGRQECGRDGRALRAMHPKPCKVPRVALMPLAGRCGCAQIKRT